MIRFLAAIAVLSLWTSTATVAADTFLGFEVLELDGAQVKWQSLETGKVPILTFALTTEDMDFPGSRNCKSMQSANRALRKSNIDLASFKIEIAAAFEMWSHAAKLEFRETNDLNAADILIGAQAQPSGRAFTDVHYKTGTGPVRAIARSLICLNPEQRWKIGFDGNLDVYDLRYTIAHEIGHAIGLDHPSASGQLMSFRYDEKFRQLQSGDITGARSIYGTPTTITVEAGGPPQR